MAFYTVLVLCFKEIKLILVTSKWVLGVEGES
jgi:hypothetical protein